MIDTNIKTESFEVQLGALVRETVATKLSELVDSEVKRFEAKLKARASELQADIVRAFVFEAEKNAMAASFDVRLRFTDKSLAGRK